MRSVLLTFAVFIVLVGIATSTALGDRSPTGARYMLHENWGGTWSDAEKSPYNSEDNSMCWAGAAANVLEWTGWGRAGGMTSTDEMFAYYQDHWTDQGGLMIYGWQWWFTGANPSNGWPGWSQVDVAGGGFHTSENYAGIYHGSSNRTSAMSTIDTYLRSGYGTTIGLYGPGGHAVTVWGFTYNSDNPSEYNGIYLTDSDDYKYHPNAPDRLRYYEVEFSNDRWHLQSYYGSNSWYIGNVHALESVRRTPGDLDGDSNVDADDIDIIAAAIRNGEYSANHDIDGDGRVTIADRNKLIRDILHSEYGDFNLNGSVDVGDYTAWADNVGSANAGWRDGDANGDGVVDSSDYTTWADMMGFVSDVSQPAATPEPATIVLLCTGGAIVLSRRKSRKR
ncbi:MAG: PEP-CTERM sorting domain-containing protein [Phycisphaerae bacterium]|jgi:hypothetical protein|nr:PEP-CTERM sorting domain-containing protein [Phycisphaerae bacterium]